MGKRGALMALMEALDVPISQARDIGQAFLERNPITFFDRFKSPAGSIAEAEAQYGVKFTPTSPKRMRVQQAAGGPEYFVKELDPAAFDRLSWGDAPSLSRVLDNMGGWAGNPYEIDAVRSDIGTGAGSLMYPAILDVMSGSLGRLNVPTELTKVNQMRRNMNTADALIRNPSLTDTVLPIDSQLDIIRMTPEDYMGLDRAGRVGALSLAHAAKTRDALNRLEKTAPDLTRAAEYIPALQRVGGLGALSSRSAFMDPSLTVLQERGIGPSSLKRMNIIDAILGGQKINPDLWVGLGKKEGGLVQYGRTC